MQKIVYKKDEICIAASKILELINQFNIILLFGEIGVGKTTLVKTIIKNLGSINPATSPTYSILNEYLDKNGNVVAYHADFYRINDINELFDSGLYELIHREDMIPIFIEWPEKFQKHIPDNCLKVYLEYHGPNTRILRAIEV